MTARELERAAALLERQTTRVAPGNWRRESDRVFAYTGGWREESRPILVATCAGHPEYRPDTRDYRFRAQETAKLIASLADPTLVTTVANWLNSEAQRMDDAEFAGFPLDRFDPALDVARHVISVLG